MKQKSPLLRAFGLLAIAVLFLLSSCTFFPTYAAVETVDSAETVTPINSQIAKNEIADKANYGFRFEMDSFDLVLPGNDDIHENAFSFAGAYGQFRLSSLSLHDLDLSLSLPLRYNGLLREADIALLSETLYLCVDARNDDNADYDIRYKASLGSYDEDGQDETTRGITYFEYGELDYFLSVILETLDISSISLGGADLGTGSIVWDDIISSLEQIEEHNGKFVWNLPLDGNTYSIGLLYDDANTLSGIEFPAKEGENQGFADFNGKAKLRFNAVITTDQPIDFTLPYPESEYHPLMDSLSFFRTIARYVNSKRFGIEAAFTLSHSEDEVLGDDEHFQQDPISEEASLSLNANCDLSETLFGGLDCALEVAQPNHSQTYSVHTEPGQIIEKTDDNGDPYEVQDYDFYLNVNNVLKAKTSVDVASALIQEVVSALQDESIQNETIIKFISSLLSTGKGIAGAIDLIKSSSVLTNIDEGHYEDILSAISEISIAGSRIEVKLDLSLASMEGTADIVLYGTSENVSLGEVRLHNVGIKGNNDSHTALTLDGTLVINPYAVPSFDGEGYHEMSHLPSWKDEINAIAKNDQLQVSIEGYALKLGTTANVHSDTKYNRTEQGFTFSGSLAFDLKNELGTGAMTFTDRKESYVNDHNLKIDVTGPEGENDNDQNDMNGSGNEHAMYFEYNSQNVTASSGTTAYKNESRDEPENSPLKGRFSIHSLNGIIDVVSTLMSSTDVRFQRLTNLLSSASSTTLLSNLLSGQYFDFLTHDLLTSVEWGENKTKFVIAAGVISSDFGAELTLNYKNSGEVSGIEIKLTLGGDTPTEVYANIAFLATEFEQFPFQFDSHSNTDFNDYSSIKRLLEFGIDTITLGVSDLSSLTTYHLGGTIEMKLLGLYTVTVSIDAYIFLDGTHVKVLAAVNVPNVAIAIKKETISNIFYESSGDDQSGTLYINRSTKGTLASPDVEHKKVSGKDFSENMVDWLLDYILNLGDTIMDEIRGGDSDKGQAMHGEDIIEGFSVASSSLSSPSWSLDIGLGALAHSSLLGTLSATISGKTATYKDSNNKTYTKQSLYSLTGSTSILGSVIKATLSFSIQNISTGTYTDAWNSDSNAFLYYYKSKKVLFVTTYEIDTRTGTAASLWSGSYGKSSANSNYVNANWYSSPDTQTSAPS